MKTFTPMTPRPLLKSLLLAAFVSLAIGCGTGPSRSMEEDQFFTSGSRAADQRASQRMARAEQLAGDDDEDAAVLSEAEPLYDRLGGEPGISTIIGDFVSRALNDPRINWQRKGVSSGGLFTFDKSVAWDPDAENVATLKRHLVQFLSLTTGGPAQYDGGNMKSVHADMKITNTEFDAAVGVFKASLDKLRVADREQKELLAILESTRNQVVTER